MRTEASEAADLAKFLAQGGAHPKPVNGVSGAPIVHMDPDTVIFGPLHVVMGASNNIMQYLSKVSTYRLIYHQCASEVMLMVTGLPSIRRC